MSIEVKLKWTKTDLGRLTVGMLLIMAGRLGDL